MEMSQGTNLDSQNKHPRKSQKTLELTIMKDETLNCKKLKTSLI